MLKRISILLVILAIVFFAIGFFRKQSSNEGSQTETQERTAKPVAVSVQTVAQSQVSHRTLTYPVAVSNRQETTVVAGASGTASQVSFAVGDRVAIGQLLVRLDEPANSLEPEKGFRSVAVQQAQNAVRAAKENYDQAKRVYDRDKTKANKTARDLAKIDYENAQISLQSTYDARLIKSPVAGIIVTKNISAGATVEAGQTLAVISPSKDIVAKFSVNKEEIRLFSLGAPVTISSGQKSFEGKISSLSPQANAETGKFLVEAKPNDQKTAALLPGTVATVSVDIVEKPHEAGAIILPLSALTTGQNESFIFTEENGKAKKNAVSLLAIRGELAEIKTSLNPESRILVRGNKLVQDGDPVTVAP